MDLNGNPARAARHFLRDLGAERLDHRGGTLLAHLDRVRHQLARWHARPALQLAGLCHACYGTDGFAAALLPAHERVRLQGVIGPEAESIVYFYASCDRQATYATVADRAMRFRDRFTGQVSTPTLQQRLDFAELTAANELDLARVDRAFRDRWGAALLDLFTRLRPLLSPGAWQSCQSVLGGRERA